MKTPPRFVQGALELLHQRQGPLTAELVREPAGFGIGQGSGDNRDWRTVFQRGGFYDGAGG